MSNSDNEINIITIGNTDSTISTTNFSDNETIYLDLSNGGAAQPVYTINDTISSIGLDSFVIGSADNITTFNWEFNTIPFENGFPDWSDFQSMCKEYPGLQITFEKMKEFYILCRSDWEDKKKGEA